MINTHRSTPSVRSISHAAWAVVRPFLVLHRIRLSAQAVVRLLKDSRFVAVEGKSRGLAGANLWRILPFKIGALVEGMASRTRLMKMGATHSPVRLPPGCRSKHHLVCSRGVKNRVY